MRARAIGVVAGAIAGLLALPAADAQQVRRRDHRSQVAAPKHPLVRAMRPRAGAPNTEVTISGRFPADAEVYVDRSKVKITKRSPQSLTFVVSSRRPGDHAVTVRAGGAEVSAGSFRVERGSGPVHPVPATPAPGPAPLPHPAPGPAPIVTDFSPRLGPPGTVVTIEGRRFGNHLQVVFGDAVVPVKKIDNRTIQFAVPKREGDSLIVLRRANRQQVVVGKFNVVKNRHPGDDRAKRQAQWRKRAQEQWKKRQAEIARRTAAERAAELRRQEEELRRQREERRKKQLAELRARWEAQFLARPAVRAEMAVHAERAARLKRMLRLAEAGNHGGLAVRIHVLIEAENARHEQRMSDLRAAYASR
ncbi:MAG TPA: IPT/TIG domain-containing protein [Kofleriaceae bacterium]|nr:IPT/TIG domain-containing protein [Kofleriaceae bacterium]